MTKSWLKDVTKAARTKIAKAKPKLPKIMDAEQLAAFFAQYPGAAKLFGVIMKVWLRSRAQRPCDSSYWAAYTQKEWAGWAKTSRATLQRNLKLLKDAGLVHTEQGHHKGTRVVAFVQPTYAALKLTNASVDHYKHLNSNTEPLAKPKKTGPFPTGLKAKTPVTLIAPDDDKPTTLAELLAVLNGPVDPTDVA